MTNSTIDASTFLCLPAQGGLRGRSSPPFSGTPPAYKTLSKHNQAPPSLEAYAISPSNNTVKVLGISSIPPPPQLLMTLHTPITQPKFSGKAWMKPAAQLLSVYHVPNNGTSKILQLEQLSALQLLALKLLSATLIRLLTNLRNASSPPSRSAPAFTLTPRGDHMAYSLPHEQDLSDIKVYEEIVYGANCQLYTCLPPRLA